MRKIFYSICLLCFALATAFAGNPDRNGAAGATQLLINPWARSAGLHTMNTASVMGVEAIQLNVAGLGRVTGTEVALGYSLYLKGTDITLNSLGLAQRIGENGSLGFSLQTINVGDIQETTTSQPEGTGATFSPRFFNIGLSYAHVFENKISVGVTMRAVSEAIANVSALGVAIDAGVQYVTGEDDKFKFGISLRNLGSRLQYNGEGLTTSQVLPNGADNFEKAVVERSAAVEIPSVLNIGISYDLLHDETNKLSVLANFTSNSFAQDQIGGGLEYSFRELFFLRGGYKYEITGNGQVSPDGLGTSLFDTGLAAGASIVAPLGKSKERTFAVDYAFRATRVYEGTHSIAVRFNL